VVWRSTDEGEGATQGLLAGGSKRVSAPQAAKTHDALHADPRAARRGSAGEQTGGGPKARTEGEREEEEGGRVGERREVGTWVGCAETQRRRECVHVWRGCS
jgi:hypothetical protein